MGLLKSNLVDQGLDQLSVAEFLANIKRSNQENSEPDVGSNKLRPSLVSNGNSSSEKQRMQQSALDRFVDVDTEKKKLEKSISDLEELSGRLQSSAMNIRMVPVRYAFDRFPVQVRETARGLNKKVRLTVSGADTELDKLLINQLIEPMLHILRNAVDHGIEPPEERKELGKNDTALIKISAYYQGSEAVIEIADDGRGIDTDNVYQKAKTLGLIDAENRDHLSREDILNLIFEPGFSTSKEVTTLSGRGVGMDAVRRAISQVHGTVTVDSVLSEGSTFKIRLPLSLAVAGVLLVTEYKYKFAFPVLHVEDILTVSSDQIELISQTEIFNYRGEALPVTTLSNILNFKGSDFNEELVTIVILSDDGKKKCVKVDSVLGRQDVIIKNLGDFIRHAPSVMGCTILSDNQLILILNSWEIVNSKKELNRYRA
jgi:two-component system chemotaxis sensor kinase CheA